MDTLYIKWCKGCENDFSFRTGCGLQNELRIADVKFKKSIIGHNVTKQIVATSNKKIVIYLGPHK